ncbi:casein kinase I [Achlya hypogyna]|uniref:Casein kinase I n=1 Tax=Achlya hypogyna TaxID=1202772 RepID=A0A1V9Z841_ACHHY|nr:casein kinase I [Achlya hypogyna]
MAVPLRKGLELKQWLLGDKLGSGACSDVYEVTLAKGNGQRYAMKVSPIPVVAAGKKKRKKTHADRSADALYAEHLLYVNTLGGHRGIPSLPPSGAYGEDKGYRFLVLQRLGRTLEGVKQAHGRLPEAVVARVGLEILDIFQHIHSKRLLFVDVKPENFMLSEAPETQVYCVDFGIAERYVLVTGAHKPFKTAGVVGTPTFLSLNCHGGSTPSRRDDVEALLYVCLYLVRGDLPWQGAASDEDGARLKRSTPLAELTADLSPEWAKLVALIRSCAFDEAPDYAAVAAGLSRICGAIPRTGVYDWGAAKARRRTALVLICQQVKATEKKPPTPPPVAIDLVDSDEGDNEPSKRSKRPSVPSSRRHLSDSKAVAAPKPKTAPKKRVSTAGGRKVAKSSPDKAAPSTRRLAAATRAVGAAAAATAAAAIATRTRSSDKEV